MIITCHVNTGYSHQRRWAEAISHGCKKHGHRVVVSSNRERLAEGDVHFIYGPWYVYNKFIGKKNVILIDRDYLGRDPGDYARIGWLLPDGRQVFAKGYGRDTPTVKDWRYQGNRALVLADYAQKTDEIVRTAHEFFSEVQVRLHPANKQTSESLSDAISRADAVIGTAGTAQIQAILDGVPTTCLDPRHIARPVTAHVIGDIIMPDRSAWLRDLAYAQWSHDEMKSGEAWEYLNATDTITRYRAGH